jgi:uncharacterized integral membrane protein
MELKRALVTVQEMSLGNSANVKAKSGEVVAGIEALLTELGAGPSSTQGMPAGIVSLEEAPAPAAVVEEPVHAKEAITEEAALAEESHEAAEPAHEPEATESAPEPVEEAHAEEGSSDSEEEGGDDEEEEDDDE